MSSSSGYETGSEKDVLAPHQVKEARRSSMSSSLHSQSQSQRQSQPFLRVGGAAYPSHRRRSLSVNR